MNKDDLSKRRQAAETKFEELTKFVQQTQNSLKGFGLENYSDVQAELNRLQGEYRVLTEQIDEPEQTVPAKAKVAEPAAKPAEK